MPEDTPTGETAPPPAPEEAMDASQKSEVPTADLVDTSVVEDDDKMDMETKKDEEALLASDDEEDQSFAST